MGYPNGQGYGHGPFLRFCQIHTAKYIAFDGYQRTSKFEKISTRLIKLQAKFCSPKQDFLAQWQSTELAIKGPAARLPAEENSFKWTLLLVAVTVCFKDFYLPSALQ